MTLVQAHLPRLRRSVAKATQPAANSHHRCSPRLAAYRDSQDPQPSVEGKVIVVTGSTDGIGLHTARRLKQLGANVVVHGRDPLRVADACASLQSIPSGQVDAVTHDLSRQSEVSKFASTVMRSYGRIDVLVNNAGVYETQYQRTDDGLEMTWAVNVAAPFLLSKLLAPVIEERIVNVSSISATSRIDWDNTQQEKGFSSHDAYGLSKLAVQMLTVSLGTQVSHLRVVSLDPGTVNTKMLLAGWGPCGIEVTNANDLLWASTTSACNLKQGGYYVGRRLAKHRGPAEDADAREQLWTVLSAQTVAPLSS